MDKQIEEMVQFIPNDIVRYDGMPSGQHLYIEQKEEIAKELLKYYQPKIPEGAVVIEQEEYNNLVERAEYAERELALKLNSLEDKIVISKKAFNENYVLIDELLIKQDLIELMKKVNSAQERKIKLLEQEPTQVRKDTARGIFADILNEENIETVYFTFDGSIRDKKVIGLDTITTLAKQYGEEVE